MWNVVEPFEVGSPADLEVVLEVVQNQSRRCLYLAEEEFELQIAATAGDSVVVEEERTVDGAEVFVEAEADSVEDVTTTGAVDVVVDMVAVDSGVFLYFISFHL